MVDHGLLQRIDGLELSPRATALRELFFATQPGVAAEQPSLAMQSWQETEGEPLDLRRAKLVKQVFEEVPVPIFRGQKIAGSQTKYFRGAYPHPEYNGKYLLSLLEEEEGTMTLGGPVERGAVTPEDFVTLRRVAQFWKGKTCVDKAQELVQELMGDWYEDVVESGTNRYEGVPAGAYAFQGAPLMERGLRGLIADARKHIDDWKTAQSSDVAKLHFWQSAVIVLEATVTLARRYAQQARDLAAQEGDPAWRSELQQIAETCDRVPENPPRNFREALQSIAMFHLALGLETPGMPPTGIGRVDQLAYPFLKRDLAEGRITIEEAGDLVVDFLQYCARQEWVVDLSWRDYIQKGVLVSIGLCGTDLQGNDVSNELSYLFLHMMGLVRYAEPHLAIAWHKDIPDWLMRKALHTNLKVGGGVPQFQNIDHFVALCQRRGIAEEHARDWVSHGCSQLVPGCQVSAMEPSYISIPLAVDLALHNGIASKTGKRIGPETGDPRDFQTFDECLAAFKTQAEHLINRQLWHDELVDRVRSAHYHQPLASTLMPGPMDNGMDFAIGGLNHYGMQFKKDRGLVSASDSLMAIKKLVYDERQLTMGELLAAIDRNYEGVRGEEIRQMCLAAPKYGNDLDEADLMLRDIAKFTGDVITSRKNIYGYHYAVNRNGQSWHFMAGKRLAALPNGRKAGMPLVDGSLSAMQGMDRKGPTALLNSALKADFGTHAIAGIITVKFPAPLFQSEDLREKVGALTGGFFEDGGTYIQYNVLDATVLRDAKKYPDRYRDLVVRVGGYSAYFVNLSPEIQDEIIERTEHSLVGV